MIIIPIVIDSLAIFLKSADDYNFKVLLLIETIINKLQDFEIEVNKEVIDTIKEVSGDHWTIDSIERQKFYAEAKKAFAVITTSDTRPYGCFIFTKGVLKPDGSVWIV